MQRQWRQRTTFILGMLVAVAVSAGRHDIVWAADANTAARAAEAKALRDKAFGHFNKREWDQAIDAYLDSLDLDRRVGAMANLASALNQGGRHVEALNWYEAALAEFPNASPKTRKTAEQEREKLLSKVGTIAVGGEIFEGARFLVDQRVVEKFPVRVMPGRHEVREEVSGFPPMITLVEVAAGEKIVATLEPKEKQAQLTIQEANGWVLHVELDGREIGLSPMSSIVTPGTHRIRLRGYMRPEVLLACEKPERPVEMGALLESEEKTVTLSLFEKKTVTLLAEDKDASLRVGSNTPRATLWIDGHDVGKTPWEGRLPLGEHAVEVRAKGFYVAKQRVTLERREQRELSVSLERVPNPPGFWTGRNVGTTVGLGIGLVGMGVFGVAGGLALQNASELKAACRNGTCPGGSEEQLATTHSLGNAALTGIIVGGVGLGASAAVWFLAAPKEQKSDTRERASLHVRMGTSGVSVEGQF